jgi:hypothetical protein
MFSTLLRGSISRPGPAIACRLFSSTAGLAAAEVKKLGVIGAGQMVSVDIQRTLQANSYLS